jgi:hypothetical protein
MDRMSTVTAPQEHTLTAPRSLRTQLDDLHAQYVETINHAIARGSEREVADLAASYDAEAIQLVAEHEGKTHLLPLHRPAGAAAPRLTRWLRRRDHTKRAA